MKLTKKTFLLWICLIGILHVALVLYFGAQKQGFHEDEYYTYWSVSSDNIGPANMTWHSGYNLQSRFFVKPDMRFSFDMVIQNQAEDVHPPLYYLALHTLMSFFPSSFYKWFGILLNLSFSLVSYLGITFLFYTLGKKTGPNAELLALFSGLIYAVAPSTISSVMLTRMYAFSTMWTILYALIFVLLITHYDCTRKQFALFTVFGALICYCAFLTHYYALFVPFFLTFFYCIYSLIRRKNILRMFVYGASMLAAIGLGVCTYPACITHIFSGYRGQGAISGMMEDTLFGRTKVFLIWLNSSILANWLIPCFFVFLAFFVLGIILFICRKKTLASKDFMFCVGSLFIANLFSFWLLTKVALMVGEDSSRYFYPVINFFLPFMACVITSVLLSLKDSITADKLKSFGKTLHVITLSLLLVVILLPIAHTYLQGKVLYLYAADAEKVSTSQEYAEYPCIMVYSSDISYRSWYVDNQLWPYENVFYVEYNSIPLIDDPLLSGAEKIVVYMDGAEEALLPIIENNPNITSYRLLRHEPFFYIYVLE